MISRWSGGFRFRRRDVEVVVFTPHRRWPGWCLGAAVAYNRAGQERTLTATVGVVQVEVLVIGR